MYASEIMGFLLKVAVTEERELPPIQMYGFVSYALLANKAEAAKVKGVLETAELIKSQIKDYIAAIKRGDLEKATELSFDCIQCGLCATRCMGELAQYHIAQMVRRIRGAKLAPPARHCDEMVARIKEGKYRESLAKLMATGEEELKTLYKARENEPDLADETWAPEDKTYL